MRRRLLIVTFCVLLSFYADAKAVVRTLAYHDYRDGRITLDPDWWSKNIRFINSSFWVYPGSGGGGSPATFDNTASALFNGSSSHINHGDQDPGASFSAFCWAKQTTATTNLAIMSKWSASTSERSWVIQAGSANAAKFSVLISGSGASVSKQYNSTVTALSTAAWHQVGFTFAGGSDTLKLYIDGTEDAAPTINSNNPVGGALNTGTAALAQGVVIKNGAGSIAAFWAGYITHCSTWDVVLSAAEVSATINAGKPADLGGHSQVANLTHWYQNGNLDDTTVTIYDRKGTAHGTNATITISTEHP